MKSKEKARSGSPAKEAERNHDRLPSVDDFAQLGDAGDELDDAFDDISGVHDAPVPPASASAPKQARANDRLPSVDDFAQLADAGDELDDAFDDISGVHDAPVPPSRESTVEDAQRLAPAHAHTSPHVNFRGAAPEDDFELDDFELHTPVSFGEALAEAWTACSPQDGPPTPFTRLRLCQARLQVHQAADINLSGHRELSEKLQSGMRLEASMHEHKAYSPERLKIESELDTFLDGFEDILSKQDQEIPTSWLRASYPYLELDVATFTDYFHAALLDASLTLQWWERIGLLALASASKTSADGRLQILAVSDAALVWDKILPRSKLSAESIADSVHFFHDAVGRLGTLKKRSELFASGFYLDIAGYQVSLREALFRPEILYASVEFHVELANWIADGPESRHLASRIGRDFSEVYEKVGTIFSSQFQDRAAIESTRARLQGFKTKAKATGQSAQKEKSLRFDQQANAERKAKRQKARHIVVGLVAVVLLVVVAVPLVTSMLGARSRDLQGLSAGAAADIHAVLSSASVSKETGLLVAHVDTDAWALLSKEQKYEVAKSILSTCRDRDLRNAFVYKDDVIAIQITEGELRYTD